MMDDQGRYRTEALGLFDQARRRARWSSLWKRINSKGTEVQCLVDGNRGTRASGRRERLETVPVDRIRGSEGRCLGFDAEFNPLQAQDRNRWVALCAAWLSGVVLPPVQLIRIGPIYYVRDGHHRVSVARALGQQQIEAEVVVWE